MHLTPRLAPNELSKLFAGYRGPEYDQQRVAVEPGYVGHISEFIDRENGYHSVRRAFYDEFHIERFGHRGLVVDMSDGDGYFAGYAFPHAELAVLPPVVVAPFDAELLWRAEVVTISHALQQHPRPREALSRIAAAMRPGAGVWIELPVQYSGGLRANFTLLEHRFERGVREFGPLQTLHETCGHFSVSSLRVLLRAAGLEAQEIIRSNVGVLATYATRP